MAKNQKKSHLGKKTHYKSSSKSSRKKTGFQKLLTAEGWKQLMTGKKR
jgi:hypothetical protein